MKSLIRPNQVGLSPLQGVFMASCLSFPPLTFP